MSIDFSKYPKLAAIMKAKESAPSSPILDENLYSDHESPQIAMSILDEEVSTSLIATDTSPRITLPDGEIDPRLKLLSHSSRTTLHKCPRKYQLYRLSSMERDAEQQKDLEQGVTFAYGSAVGVGVQSVLEDKTETQIYMDTFLEWDVDFLAENPKQKKSFALCMFAVQNFIQLREDGFLKDYELVYHNGAPAVELAFEILLPNGFKYRGFLDAVLKHKLTGEVMCLENKTSSGTANSTTFKNSGQALGYSVVLDQLFPELSSYVVLYLVYETKSYRYVELPFTKTLLQRALWLQELLIDTQMIELYDSYDVYPMHGESCLDFFRDCEYLDLCTLDTSHLTKPLTEDIVARIEKSEEVYKFSVSFEELIEAQISKGTI